MTPYSLSFDNFSHSFLGNKGVSQRLHLLNEQQKRHFAQVSFDNTFDSDRLVIALTPTCPSIGREPSEELKELVNNGLGEVIYNYAKENPFIIKEYKEGFPIIMG